MTTEVEKTLLGRLMAMRIEPAGARTGFAARLAGENGWTPGFADQVMTEYRRFLFLAATTGREMTPSDAVDQAWHLHLAYSRHYWGVLCGEILHRPLHHGPTAGGADERQRYDTQYRDTLAAYAAAFGHRPPVSIWPAAAERFGPHRFERVDRSRQWVVPRRSAPAALLLPLLAGCAALGATSGGAAAADSGFGGVFGLGLVLVVGLVIVNAIRRSNRGGRRGDDSDGCGGSDSDSSDSSDSSYSSDSGCGGGGCGGGGD